MRDDVMEPWRMGRHTVPGLWRYILPREAHAWRVPDERHASCGRCPKVVTHGFRPDYRCCTFHPRIPNYMLGFALKAGGPFADRIRKAAREGFLTPEGSHHTPTQWFQALAADKAGAYGRGDKVLCHYLDQGTGLCTAYAFRNSACATYHCENDHGAAGAAFWDSLHHYMSRVEYALADWALEAVGFDVARYRDVFAELTTQPLAHVNDPATQAWRPEAYARLWLDHAGREAEFYEACADAVHDARDRLRDIAGERVLALPLAAEVAPLESMSAQARPEGEDAVEAEENETLTPIGDLWTVCEKKAARIWRPMPEGARFRLSSMATLTPNPGTEELETFFAHCPGVLRVHTIRHGKRRVAREQYLTPAEWDAARRLAAGATWDQALRDELRGMGVAAPEDFAVEMLRIGAFFTGKAGDAAPRGEDAVGVP